MDFDPAPDGSGLFEMIETALASHVNDSEIRSTVMRELRDDPIYVITDAVHRQSLFNFAVAELAVTLGGGGRPDGIQLDDLLSRLTQMTSSNTRLAELVSARAGMRAAALMGEKASKDTPE